jgi:uncharacterized protein
MRRIAAIAAVGLALLADVVAAGGVPPIPKDSHFIQDYAGIIPTPTRDRIGRLQRNAFLSNDTPIMVVTIRSMADYARGGSTIEAFANEWFNAWQIGKRLPDGTLVNKGMLLLVSVGDRKARIEFGADWGHDADRYAENVMSDAIIPSFKQGRYDQGIYNGVAALAELAALRPEGVPSAPISDSFAEVIEQVTGPGAVSTSPFPKHIIFIVSAIGAVLVGLSFVFPGQRKTLLVLGIGLIVAAWAFWVILVIVALVSKKNSRHSGGGFSSSGGFGSGGFSGGGGASGSW